MTTSLRTFAGFSEWLKVWRETVYAEVRLGLVHALGHVPYPNRDSHGPDWATVFRADYLARIDICIEQVEHLMIQLEGMEKPARELLSLLTASFKYATGYLTTDRCNYLGHDRAILEGLSGPALEKATLAHERENGELLVREAKIFALIANIAFLELLPKTGEHKEMRRVFLDQIKKVASSAPDSWYDAVIVSGNLDLLPENSQGSEALRRCILGTRESFRLALWEKLSRGERVATEYIRRRATESGFDMSTLI